MRKEKTVIIEDGGRQLTFKIRQMPALQLEDWIEQAALLLVGTGLLDGEKTDIHNVGDIATSIGRTLATSGLAAFGKLEFEKVRPLRDALLTCCTRVDAGIEQPLTPDTLDGFIEDVRTLFKLRKEAIAINFGFFARGGQSVSPDGGEKASPQATTSNPRISPRSQR